MGWEYWILWSLIGASLVWNLIETIRIRRWYRREMDRRVEEWLSEFER